MKKLFARFIEFLRNPEIDFQTRVFSMITAIGVAGVFIAFLGDIAFGENMIEIVVLGLTVLVTPIITIVAVKFNKLKAGAVLIALGIIFIILPVAFFFGGGVSGGAIIWITFCYLYIGLGLTGAWKYIMLTMLTGMTVFEYNMAYFHPERIHSHNTEIYFKDSILSVIALGFVSYYCVAFLSQLFIDENKRARDQAKMVEELNKSQNRFFSNMSHEIRTPINTILGLNEIILRQDDISEEIAKDSRSIEGAGQMLLTIINDILDMSRLESGNMDIVPVSYRVGDMLSEIVNMVWARADAKGLRFKIDVDPSTPVELFGDEVRIKQVLINLLTNAIKYTREGMVKLYVESDPLGDNEVIITFAVSDTGMGIKREALPHLFDAFKRMDEEKNRNIEGTGLGLAIVKQLIDLMGGEITVNSVYTQGSTFVVKLRQSIVNPQAVGNIIIGARSSMGERSVYKQTFEAPEASVLIVDDNELNLKVETKLLSDTKMSVDTAMSGEEALALTQNRKYDIILMDHLMPEMDGIECLGLIRSQTGGLNRNTPVVVLTANAGSENKELYRVSGFDGYLCKPVSGAQLEATLIMHMPKDKIISRQNVEDHEQTVTESDTFIRKTAVVITTSSMCDLPAYAIRNLNIAVIPYKVCTDKGVFLDEVEVEASEVIRYIESGKQMARTQSPDIIDLEQFFANQLTRARYVIHITAAGNTLREYSRAVQAAKAFGNVSVIDSGRLSSSMGMLVLAAYRMAQQNYDISAILDEVEHLKKRLPCTYVVTNTGFMSMSGHISQNFNMVARSFMLHPMIVLKDGRMEANKVFAGSIKRAWRKYIDRVIPKDHDIETDLVFITYVGLSIEDLKWIEEQVRKRIEVRRIILQPASSTTAINCGPGTFGILYLKKGEKSYNLSSLIPEERTRMNETATENVVTYDSDAYDVTGTDSITEVRTSTKDVTAAWYQTLEGIDGEEGIRNCGGEDSYKPVLEIFYDSYDEKASEIEAFYDKEDWDNYSIRIHALKSSARIIGAVALGDEAQRLETAGKDKNEAYIHEHHRSFMEDYGRIKEVLSAICEPMKDEDSSEDKKTPMADDYIIEGVYEAVREAADSMDIEAIEEALNEVKGYALPEDVADDFKHIRSMAELFDYQGISQLISEREEANNG